MCPLSVRTSAPVVASHTFAVPSRLAVTIRDPSGLNDADWTPIGVPLEGEDLGTRRRVPHLRRPVPTRGHDPRPVRAERRRSDATPVCPLRVRTSAPVVASHTFAVPSSLAVTIRDPSGLNDAEVDGDRCAP